MLREFPLSENKQPHPTCYQCGKVFDPTKRTRTASEFNLTSNGPLCRNQPECRGRVLSQKYEERGLKRWARQTQEELLALMDLPPRGWNPAKKWESVHPFHDRVFAAIKFYSVCWPVCLEFAVQTDADGEPIKEHGEWKRHTHRSLGAILHLTQTTVTRSVIYLKRRRLLAEIDGRLYPDLAPKSLNPQERDACTRINESILKDLAALPRKVLRTLEELWPSLEPDACTRIKAISLDACIQLNRAISDARTVASQKVLDACTPHLSLLSRSGDYRQTPRASSHSAPPKNRSPLKPTLDKEERRVAAEYLYAEIPRMQVAFPKSPFSQPRFTLGKADRILVSHILDALEPTNYNATGFVLFIAARFKGLDGDGLGKLKPRSPNDPGGPRSLGLLIDWAKDYAAESGNGHAKGAAR